MAHVQAARLLVRAEARMRLQQPAAAVRWRGRGSVGGVYVWGGSSTLGMRLRQQPCVGAQTCPVDKPQPC